MLTSETLNRAADEIERRGWRGWGSSGDSWGGGASSNEPVCLEGGILAAMGLSTEPSPIDGYVVAPEGFVYCPAMNAVRDYLGNNQRPFTFNDAEGRTQAEVIEVLRAAAAIEQAREAEVALVGVLR